MDNSKKSSVKDSKPKSSGTEEKVPAFRGKGAKKNVGKGAPVRPATYTNRNGKGPGVMKESAYRR